MILPASLLEKEIPDYIASCNFAEGRGDDT
jgi:hypothetical protein